MNSKSTPLLVLNLEGLQNDSRTGNLLQLFLMGSWWHRGMFHVPWPYVRECRRNAAWISAECACCQGKFISDNEAAFFGRNKKVSA